MYSILLHDERLSGNTPHWSDRVGVTVDEDDPIDRVLGWVSYSHRAYGQIEDLAIQCHGYVSAANGMGGHGLEFSKDGVFLSNIYKWRAIQGMAKWIFIYACNVAEVDPGVPANQGDGRQLCLQMAAMTGATVIAPLKAQEYDLSINPFHWREIKFGDWEGPVYGFSPDGSVINISQIIGGG